MNRWLIFLLVLITGLATQFLPAREEVSEPGSTAVMRIVEKDGQSKLQLPLKRTQVRAQVTEMLAVTDITQIYLNDTGRKIETVYQFPLPHDGAVTDMVVRINQRTVMGVIKERGEAQREYEQARREGKTASLVEQERPNLFTQSITNIQPGDEIQVTLRVFHPLRYSAGRLQYAFPITVGPRYMGGQPKGRSWFGWSSDTDQVPDASRVSPKYLPKGTGSSHFLDLELTFSTQVRVKRLRSTSHEIEVRNNGEHRQVVTLAPSDRIPNKDFILEAETESDAPQFSLLTHCRRGEDGFFCVTILPPTVRNESKIIPKEIVFILDRSGSMSGAPIQKAREALVKALKKLNSQDSFNIIAFDNRVERLWDRPQPVSSGRIMDATRWVETLEARGGTEMKEPLCEALGYARDSRRQRIVLFITDGNVGYEDQLVSEVGRRLGEARIFAVGIGSAVNRNLVDRVAAEGKGVADFIRQDEDVAEKLSALYRKISNPILMDVRLEFEGVEVYGLYPEKARDLFFEEPTVLVGRYRSGGRGTFRLTARSADKEVAYNWPIDFPEQERENPALRYAWARQKIDVLGRQVQGGEGSWVREEIIGLSKEYSVLSPYTAFIAVEREQRGNRWDRLEQWIIPSELPEGLRYEGFGPEIQVPVNNGPVYREEQINKVFNQRYEKSRSSFSSSDAYGRALGSKSAAAPSALPTDRDETISEQTLRPTRVSPVPADAPVLKELAERIGRLSSFDRTDAETVVQDLANERGLDPEDVLKSLRRALGLQAGDDVYEAMEKLGQRRCVELLKEAARR